MASGGVRGVDPVGIADPALTAVGLAPMSEQVYLFVVGCGRTTLHEVAEAFHLDLTVASGVLDDLRDVGLIALPEVPGGSYAAIDPQIALGAVADQLVAQASSLRDRIPALAEQFRSTAAPEEADPMTVLLTDPVDVASWYARLQHQAGWEMLTFDRPPYISLGMEPLQVSTIARGVTWRVVYAAESFTREDAWEETVRMGERGEQARIAPTLPVKLVVVDRSIALVGLRLDGASVESMVTESPPLVALLVETFESYWRRGMPLVGGGPSLGGTAGPSKLGDGAGAASPSRPRTTPPSREQQAILALVGAGLTDEVIAARLGISVRSLRRRSQRLMQELGAANRFQMGVEAARRGWV